MKLERPDLVVCLISFDFTGSLQSRASAAGVDTVFNMKSFHERFEAIKAKNRQTNGSITINKVPENQPEEASGRKAFVLPIISAAGGTGKSAVSIVTAQLCQTTGLKTLLIDADLQFGDIFEKYSDKRIHRIDDILADSSLVDEVEPIEGRPAIIGCPGLPEYSEKVMKELPALLDVFSTRFDVIVLNTGSFWGEEHAYLLERCSCAFMLLGQTPSSIQSTKRAVDLYVRCGIATGSVIYAINFCVKRALYTSIDISCALGGTTVAEIKEGGLEVDELITAGQAIDLLKEKNPMVLSIWAILKKILPGVKNKQSGEPRHQKQKIRRIKKRKRA